MFLLKITGKLFILCYITLLLEFVATHLWYNFLTDYFFFRRYKMPLPPALAARLAKRGLIKVKNRRKNDLITIFKKTYFNLLLCSKLVTFY